MCYLSRSIYLVEAGIAFFLGRPTGFLGGGVVVTTFRGRPTRLLGLLGDSVRVFRGRPTFRLVGVMLSTININDYTLASISVIIGDI